MGQKITKRWFWRKKTTTKGIPIQNDKAEKWKDIAVRAGKTFLQSFIASLPVDAALIAGGWNVWRAALTAATAAGISAVMNYILSLLKSKGGNENGQDLSG